MTHSKHQLMLAPPCLNNAGHMEVKVKTQGPRGKINDGAVEKCRQSNAVVKIVGIWDANNLGFKSQLTHFREVWC